MMSVVHASKSSFFPAVCCLPSSQNNSKLSGAHIHQHTMVYVCHSDSRNTLRIFTAFQTTRHFLLFCWFFRFWYECFETLARMAGRMIERKNTSCAICGTKIQSSSIYDICDRATGKFQTQISDEEKVCSNNYNNSLITRHILM